MKTMVRKLQGLVFCLAFLTALVICGRVEAQAADNTITISIEKFTLGGGFVLEPTVVPITPGETYESVITRVLDNNHIGYRSSYDEKGFYLEGISGESVANPRVPDCVQKIVDECCGGTLRPDYTPQSLDEGDYAGLAGWMYYVNNNWVLGMSSVHAYPGDVCRVQFTLYLGVDLEGEINPSMEAGASKKYYNVADKSDLMKKMGQMNQKSRSSWTAAERSVYDRAVQVMETMDADSTQVTDALYDLNHPKVLDSEQSGGSDEPGDTKPGGDSSQPGGDTGSLSLSLNKTSLSLTPNAVGSIGYTVSPDSASMTWSSSNPGVAVVEGHATGAIVTAKAPGTATITATAKSGSQTKTASCTVTVTGEASDEDFTKGAPKVSEDKAKTSASSVTISWEAYPGAEKYNVLRKKTGETFTTLATVGADTTTYTDSTVQPNTNYSYTVEAVKDGLKSGRDTNCLVKTPKADDEKPAEAKKPVQVKISKVTAVNYNSLTVTWAEAENATGYIVSRSTSKSKGYKTVKTVAGGSTTSYVDTGLKTGTTYYYKVQAINDAGSETLKGAASAAKSGKCTLGKTTVTVTPGKKKAVVKWEKVDGANGYVVYRSTSKSKNYKAVKTIKNGTTVTFTNTKLTSKKTYYYKVRAYRTVSGKKVYSAYSGVVGKKIK